MMVVKLPDPVLTGTISVEATLAARRSVRSFSGAALTLGQVSQLLWAAQGLTDKSDGGRTAPSAGALYPLEILLAAGKVEGLEPGIYRYRPAEHCVVRLAAGDCRGALAAAASGQDWMATAPATVCVSAVFERTTRKYGQRGNQYVHMEVGHAAQNVYLQAQSVGLATCMIGAFNDTEVQRVLGLPDPEKPLALLPFGQQVMQRR